MKKITTLAVAVVLSATSAGAAFAHPGHGFAPGTESAAPIGPMGGNGHDMMQMMMRMHGALMGSQGMAQKGMMGSNAMSGMGMMDRDMMRMMMGDGTMGMPSPDALHDTLQSRFEEFDADGNGTLSIGEFEALHSAMIRETMVDRFQHLDADGDGQITTEEMDGPATRLELRQMMGQGQTPEQMMPFAGGMMDGDHEDMDGN